MLGITASSRGAEKSAKRWRLLAMLPSFARCYPSSVGLTAIAATARSRKKQGPSAYATCV